MNFMQCSIEELTAECKRLRAERDAQLARLAELEPLAQEHAELKELKEKGGAGRQCLEAARRILGLRLMKQALGEPLDDVRRHMGGDLYDPARAS